MDTIIRCVALILVAMVSVAHRGVNGLCVWPCSRQHRTYTFVGSFSATVVFGLPGDLTLITTTDAFLTNMQCIERSGPFYNVRFNNGTHDLYRCNKDTLYHPEGDVLVVYANEYRYFETSPTICDVCDGKDDNIVLTGCFVFVGYFETVPTICDVCDGTDYNIVLTGRDEAVSNCRIPSGDEIPEFGCNIPSICPATMYGQIQCTRCEPSEGDDDGLCCKQKRLMYRYKSYDKPSRPNVYNRRNKPSK